MNEISDLNGIRHKEIVDIRQEISTTLPLDHKGTHEPLTEIPLVLFWDSHKLFIYNSWKLIGNLKNIRDLIGQYVIEMHLENDALELILSGGVVIHVDLSDDGFNGPESIVLYGPNNQFIVWN